MSKNDLLESPSSINYAAYVVEFEEGSIEAKTLKERTSSTRPEKDVLYVRAPEEYYDDHSSFMVTLRRDVDQTSRLGIHTLTETAEELRESSHYREVLKIPTE